MMVSIIVPIYNAEKYLDQCIQSLICQSYKNIEIVLVDDGSKDSSVKICEKYSAQDSRLKVIAQKNSGVSVARNNGVAVAHGEYIMFVDSDDFLEMNAVSRVVEAHEKQNADVVIFNYYKTDNHCKYKCDPVLACYQSQTEFIEACDLNLNTVYYNKIYNKLYKRSIIMENGVRFPEGMNMGEDLLFNLQYFTYCDSFLMIDEYLYNYRIDNASSLMHTVAILSGREILDEIRHVIEFFENNSLRKNQYQKGLDRYILDKIIVYTTTLTKNNIKCADEISFVVSSLKKIYQITDYSGFKYNGLLRLAWKLESGKIFIIRHKLVMGRYKMIMRIKGETVVKN